MRLTKLQRKNLDFIRKFRGRDQPMTFAGLLWMSRVRYLVLLTFFAAAGGWMYQTWGNPGAATLAAALVGVLVRDLGAFRRAALVWPLNREIIDWSRVDRLLAEDDAGNAAPPAG